MLRYFLVALGMLSVACTKKNPVLVCANGTCSDPLYPFCDVDGAVDGEPGACIAVSCAPNTFAACDADNAITCDQAGTNYTTQHCVNGCSTDSAGCNVCQPSMSVCGTDGELHDCDAEGHDTPTPCAAGCIDAPAPHCAYLSPNYLPNVCDVAGQGALNITSSQMLDTSLDATCNGGIVPQTGGPDICVVRYATMSVSGMATLRVAASVQHMSARNRPIAFVVDGDLVIDGTLDGAAIGFRSSTRSSGPGGGYVSSGGNDLSAGGLGGAGFATHGGDGGSPTADGGAQNGGVQLPNPTTMSVFAGGPEASAGGGGGVMLVSCRGTVSISGVVSLGGGGGLSGNIASNVCVPGGGGGAGGNLLVEGVNVNITGSLFANGGGGGAGCVPTTQMTLDQDGEDGQLSDIASASGGGAVSGAGSGGAGGLQTNAPGDGRRSTVSGDYPGGGGGSVGWLQVGTPAAIAPTVMPAHASPPIQSSVTVGVH